MARKNPRSDETSLDVNRRKFLAGVAVTGAAATAVTSSVKAAPPAAAGKIPSVLRPTARQIAAEAGVTTEVKPMAGRAGSDFMVDVIKSLDIDYCYSNPASSFRGIHELLINYGKNTKPEFITCMHEESSVAMAHGNFKVTGKPQMVLCHGTVGLMHATMAIYNAWADRVPVIVVGGNDLDAAHRAPGVPTYHSGQDINALVRDITKWDDNPVSLQHFAQSFVRAYKMSMTPPYEPVMIALDGGLQEEPIGEHAGSLYIPKYVRTAPPHADTAALRETAKMLANAENPVIVVDRMARSQNGVDLLVQLAELVQAPVVDQSNRMNFPNTHPLNQSAQAQPLIRNADLIIGLEVSDFWNTVNQFIDNGLENGSGERQSRIKPGTKLITISSAELNQKSNYQDFQRFQSVDISMVGDAEASLPYLIEAVKSAIPGDRKAAYEKRGEALKKAWQQSRERSRQAAAIGWEANPDQRPTDLRGGLGSDQGPRLFAGGLAVRHRLVAGAALEDGQASSLARRLRWRWRRVWPAGVGRRSARQQAARALLGVHAGRWRSDVRARRDVDSGAPQDTVLERAAEQQGLSSGSDARATDVEPPQPGCQSRHDHRGQGPNRHAHREPGHELPETCRIDGMVCHAADFRSGGAWSRVEARR